MDLSRFENDLLEVDENYNRPCLKFDAYCELLRKNDPRITQIRYYEYHDPKDGKPYHGIGQALQGNNHITAIEVLLGQLYTLDQELDPEYEYWCYDNLDSEELEDLVEEGAASAEPLLSYIHSCTSLHALQLSCQHEEWNLVNGKLAGMFYQAVLDNPRSGLEELQVDKWEEIDIPREEFTHLLATQPLKRLTLRMGVPLTRDILANLETNSLNFTALWLNEALHSCISLEYLSLLDLAMQGGGGYMELDRLFDSVISSLGSHPCLRELRVRLDDSTNEDIPAEALSQLLSSTGSLETLHLSGVSFSSNGMKHIAAGLQSNNTLIRLLLDGNFPAVPNEFSEYLQSRQTQPSSLRELAYQYSGMPFVFADAMVLKPYADPKVPQYSVGSALRTLRVGNHSMAAHEDVARFFSSYAVNASEIYLECLTFDNLYSISCKAMAEWIPNLIHLRELNVSSIVSLTKEIVAQLIESTKKNGSLHSMTLPSGYHVVKGFYSIGAVGVSGKDLLMSYGQRNRSIPILLSDPEGSNEGKANVMAGWLFPTLFSAAQQASRTAPTMLLLGLRTLAGGAGPFQSKKRLRE
jgi:hypothetical protein